MGLMTPLLEKLADRYAKERFPIGRRWDPVDYLVRYVLYGKRNEGTGSAVYLHHFLRSDDDSMHDHPWPFTSIILFGGYYETIPGPGWKAGVGPRRTRWYGPGRVLRRPANWIHRVQIPDGQDCWTLIIRGPKEKSWGFWCPHGYRPWREHQAVAERTQGDGCG